MNFTSTDLKPLGAGNPVKQVSFRLPLTPFFIAEGTSGSKRTRSFNGSSFYLQNKSTRWGDESGYIVSDDPICGTAAYRIFTSEDFADPPFWTGSRTRDYVFDTGANTVTVQTVEEGTPDIGLDNSRTATHSYSGDRFSDPPDYAERTLSGSVDKAWLEGWLSDWKSQSEAFRIATGGGLSTYAYIGHGATKSESDGWLAIVGGGSAVAFPWTFSGTPSGMTGDEGTLWNGRFSAYGKVVTRKNAPAIHRESSPSHLGLYSNFAIGMSIYKDGYTEVEVSDPVGDLWVDEFGVFSSSGKKGSSPLQGITLSLLDGLPYLTGDGQANELMIVSRTGLQYRVTIQSGGGYGDDWTTDRTYVLTTDSATLRASVEFDAYNSGWMVRVSKVERQSIINGVPVWETIADADAGDNFDALMQPELSDSCELLISSRKRDGQRFGHFSLDYGADPDTRYLKKTYRMHLSPGTYTVDGGGCGGGVSGNADVEYVDAYDKATGAELPRSVTQLAISINGTNWTPETLPFIGSFSGSTQTVDSPTKNRWEGSYSTEGSFLVRFDVPYPTGKVIDQQWSKVSVSLVSGANKAGPVALDPPAAGYSRFFEGYRLTW